MGKGTFISVARKFVEHRLKFTDFSSRNGNIVFRHAAIKNRRAYFRDLCDDMGYLLWSVRMLLFPKVEGFENSVEKFFSWAADLREILDGKPVRRSIQDLQAQIEGHGSKNLQEFVGEKAASLREILDGTSEGDVLCPPVTVFGKSIPPAN